ncbi:MAG: succinate--CoA ligase subunit beta [Candidatus Muproteobacteria bacterium RIFCSPHIGHO2_01_FULL_65_16]|uniref:Succinate--CoA ligase [ADP-forming] subunit beta n=1 Tax=Candidatus Muproteobacteria bacterium RIFCSPHIGHO2_01_FULL_65_16 TaxID=1817764 RepID=A0A1F6TQN1_9PROT|nr:MAG: succinate--CoA ligase subunit beta [Candidatus Muproteobacteria bacterium RIFCSPHIGHO2_01_FULL_65_16]
MNLHEYQAKAILVEAGVPAPAGKTAASAAEALAAAQALGGDSWVVKAQVHAGGRGKAGGVKKVSGRKELEAAAQSLLGSRLVTHQTGPAGQPVERLLIESPCAVAREFYLACLVDRALERIVLVVSGAGGMDIEEIAAKSPAQIQKAVCDPIAGLQAYQCREAAYALGLADRQVDVLTRIMLSIYRLFRARDLNLVEINPLAVTADGALLALDAKIQVDDNALYRHKDLEALRDPSQDDPKEVRARAHDLNYIALGGNIGCMVNGAGLAMATMDLIKLHGGMPANFLDVGGGTTAERVAEAFKIILADEKVRAILVNIFGGIVRCDLIAEGIIKAVREVGVSVPVVVRLEGTNVDKGRALLKESGLKILTADSLTEAAQKVVAAAKKA